MKKFERPRGTRDYLPDECRVRRYVMEKIREVFEAYGYGEVITPAFEHLELLEAKAGSEIKEQIYWFEDKAGRRLGLRFELTTPIARIVANMPQLPKPIRFYYIAPVWRYEEPQRGRLREFWQAGVELIGSELVDADAEVMALTRRVFEKLKLEKAVLRINSRKVAEALALKVGVGENVKEDFFRCIDKLYKQGAERVKKLLLELGLSDKSVETTMKIITLQGNSEEKIKEARKILGDLKIGEEGLRDIESLLEILIENYGIKEDFIQVDFSIVRGIAYYTGLVFEVIDERVQQLGALAAGGRYDDLIELCGGPSMPATGMAVGIERTIEALRLEGLLPPIDPGIDAMVIPVQLVPELKRKAIQIAEMLRKRGFRVIVDVLGRRLRSNLEYADKVHVKFAIIVGARELEKSCVILRDMRKREQSEVSIEKLPETLASLLTD